MDYIIKDDRIYLKVNYYTRNLYSIKRREEKGYLRFLNMKLALYEIMSGKSIKSPHTS